MNYTNNEIDVEGLPRAEVVSMKQVHPDYLRVMQLSWGIVFLILLAILITVCCLVKPLQVAWILALIAGGYLLLVFGVMQLIKLSFRIKRYAVREKDILYKTGWITEHLHMVPFNRMQHCVVESGWIERRFGLASISLYTAASEGSDITIHGLPLADAESLREHIIAHIKPLDHEQPL